MREQLIFEVEPMESSPEYPCKKCSIERFVFEAEPDEMDMEGECTCRSK